MQRTTRPGTTPCSPSGLHTDWMKALAPLTVLLFTLALLAPPLFLPRPAAAQWVVTDQYNNPIDGSQIDGRSNLIGNMTGTASNTYPDSVTAAAFADPVGQSWPYIPNKGIQGENGNWTEPHFPYQS